MQLSLICPFIHPKKRKERNACDTHTRVKLHERKKKRERERERERERQESKMTQVTGRQEN